MHGFGFRKFFLAPVSDVSIYPRQVSRVCRPRRPGAAREVSIFAHLTFCLCLYHRQTESDFSARERIIIGKFRLNNSNGYSQDITIKSSYSSDATQQERVHIVNYACVSPATFSCQLISKCAGLVWRNSSGHKIWMENLKKVSASFYISDCKKTPGRVSKPSPPLLKSQRGVGIKTKGERKRER